MATSGGLETNLTTDGYAPSEALGLVDLRDITSTFPGDSTGWHTSLLTDGTIRWTSPSPSGSRRYAFPREQVTHRSSRH